MGSATMNLDLSMVPRTIEEGVYACLTTIDGTQMQSVMHYGPRPVFRDTLSCEVHILDTHIVDPPSVIEVRVIEKLRDVADFATKDDLVTQIQSDIERARGILAAYGGHHGQKNNSSSKSDSSAVA